MPGPSPRVGVAVIVWRAGREVAEGEPVVMEPTQCAEWRWVEWDAMPEPLFLPIRNLKAQGYRP